MQRMKIRHMIKLEDVKHAQTWRLKLLNDKLSGLNEYRELKTAIKQEINSRKKKLNKD